MWHKHWTETIYVGQWPIFHGPVILPYVLEDYLMDNVIIGILDPCDAKIYHIKCMRVSDLHFMVQWLSYILKTFWWRNVVLKILIQCEIKFDLHIYIYVGQWPLLAHLSRRLTRWAYRMGLEPASVPVSTLSNMSISETSKPIQSNFIWSIIGVGERLHYVLVQIRSELWFPWQRIAPIGL